jgi:hypothetical protein
MKRIVLGLGIALSLSVGTVAARAHVRWGVGIGWPFWPCWSVGVGVGAGWGCWGGPAGYYSYPAYSYPVYGYSPPPAQTLSPPDPAPPAAPAPTALTAPAWVPSTPGTGAWVPDPTPYRYTPAATTQPASTARAAAGQTTVVTRSPEGVRLYLVK